MTVISIIGAGHVGCALAFDLASRGHDVTLRSTSGHPGNIPTIVANNNRLESGGAISGCVSVRSEEGLSRSTCFTETIIFIAIPSQGHDAILAELSLHDLSNQMLIFITGNGVAVRARRVLNAKIILDTATSPYSSRVDGFGI
ncbi:hypothetical protein K4F52_009973, partial [Lecanicillium sp. MT-2017a]